MLLSYVPISYLKGEIRELLAEQASAIIEMIMYHLHYSIRHSLEKRTGLVLRTVQWRIAGEVNYRARWIAVRVCVLSAGVWVY